MKFSSTIATSLTCLAARASAFAPVSKTPLSRYAPTAKFATSAAQTEPRSFTNTEKLSELYNKQVTNELTASQLYLAASIWAEKKELVGTAAYMRSESEEERGHAMKFIEFGNKRNIDLELEALEAPPKQWSSVEDLWKALLDAEKENTEALKRLADVAMDTRDHALISFLEPFHMEQVNSEDELETIVSKVRHQSQTPGLLQQLDAELAPSEQPKV